MFSSAGDVCRASAGACDYAEACTGTGAGCPADALVAAGTVCRVSRNACDQQELCTGGAVACPADGFVPNGSVCSGGACQGGMCIPDPIPPTPPTPQTAQDVKLRGYGCSAQRTLPDDLSVAVGLLAIGLVLRRRSRYRR